ncbi:MAG: lipoprotein [Gammaproteobacteria bacterium]
MSPRLILRQKQVMILLLFVLLLPACGQKGDLYLPDNKQLTSSKSLLPG